jgi:hypothetical protein
MSRYLSRLKQLLAEERPPEELTKPTEGAFVGFVSDQGDAHCDDEAAIEERAALAADSVPAVFLDAWARLNHQKPAGVSETEWLRAKDDGGRFLDKWGSEAAELRYSPSELFDVGAGVIWRLAGEPVLGVGSCWLVLRGGRRLARGN